MGEELSAGTLLTGRYRLEHVLGAGGAGTTYLARDELRGGRVALKVMHEREGAAEELRLLRGLSHPNLARLRDFGQLEDGRTFFTADHVAGCHLGELAERSGWGPVARVLVGAIEALRWLHGVGIRHGDVKADNVLVRGDEGVLIDLSCAAPFGVTGPISGTPGYIAPEVLDGASADGHADRYALGVLLERLGALVTVPKAVRTLARACRHEQPAGRPDLAEVVAALGGEPVPLVAPWVEPARLIGRDGEVARLAQFLDGASGAALLIVGGEGIGKSRVLEEAKWLARTRFSVIEGDA